ncbi:MAG: hypothetical protein JW838_05180 [Spirochaetes bacterium]|nr:hypothetical protein [Spirochaetota bacterium]
MGDQTIFSTQKALDSAFKIYLLPGGAPIKKTASIAYLLYQTVDFTPRGSNVAIEYRMQYDL